MGPRQARAIVYTNDKAAEANLVGEGTSPTLELDPSELKFGNVLVGKPSAMDLKIKNTGSGSLTLYTMTLGGADASSFILTPPTLPLTLQPQASVVVSVSLKPDAERVFSARLVMQLNDPNTPSVTVSLSGAGVHQQIQLSDSLLNFGQQLINNTSNKRTVRVTNSSESAVTLTSLTVVGSGDSQFALEKLSLPLTLGAKQAQDVNLTFTALDAVDVNCTLKIAFSDLPLPLEVALHGKGIPAVLSIQPSPLDFGGVRLGGGKRERPLTITNLSSDPIVLAAPEVTYNTGEPFLYADAIPSGCNNSAVRLQGCEVNPSGSIIVSVGYQPMEETLSETTLSFGTTTPQKPRAVDVQLKGRAVKHLLSADPGSLDFGIVKLNKPEEPQVVTVTNKSAQQQRVVVKLRDIEDTPFILETKALADPIPSGGSATFSVTFGPEKTGVVENEVQVWLQGDTEPEALIPVKGDGRDPKVSGGGCSASTTEAGSAGLLMLLALVGLGSRRRRRG
jgi:MYXO-CTERM domain-containing protein